MVGKRNYQLGYLSILKIIIFFLSLISCNLSLVSVRKLKITNIKFNSSIRGLYLLLRAICHLWEREQSLAYCSVVKATGILEVECLSKRVQNFKLYYTCVMNFCWLAQGQIIHEISQCRWFCQWPVRRS